MDGVVVDLGQDSTKPKGADPDNKGNWVRVKDSKGEYTDYYHLGSVKNKIGDKIKKGNNIGSAENTVGSEIGDIVGLS